MLKGLLLVGVELAWPGCISVGCLVLPLFPRLVHLYWTWEPFLWQALCQCVPHALGNLLWACIDAFMTMLARMLVYFFEIVVWRVMSILVHSTVTLMVIAAVATTLQVRLSQPPEIAGFCPLLERCKICCQHAP